MAQAVLDSDIFWELLAQKSAVVAAHAADYFTRFGNFTISAMTYFEVQKGLIFRPKPKVTTALSRHMRDLVVLPMRKEETELAGTIHGVLKQSGRSIGEGDPVIAATAIIYGLALVTNNTRHYQFVIEAGFPLRLENWREP